jgi:hypothetical protein
MAVLVVVLVISLLTMWQAGNVHFNIIDFSVLPIVRAGKRK